MRACPLRRRRRESGEAGRRESVGGLGALGAASAYRVYNDPVEVVARGVSAARGLSEVRFHVEHCREVHVPRDFAARVRESLELNDENVGEREQGDAFDGLRPPLAFLAEVRVGHGERLGRRELGERLLEAACPTPPRHSAVPGSSTHRWGAGGGEAGLTDGSQLELQPRAMIVCSGSVLARPAKHLPGRQQELSDRGRDRPGCTQRRGRGEVQRTWLRMVPPKIWWVRVVFSMARFFFFHSLERS